MNGPLINSLCSGTCTFHFLLVFKAQSLPWPQLASPGLTWSPLASLSLPWPLLASPSLTWPPLASPGLLWPPWLHLASPGFSLPHSVSLSLPGLTWPPLDPLAHLAPWRPGLNLAVTVWLLPYGRHPLA